MVDPGDHCEPGIFLESALTMKVTVFTPTYNRAALLGRVFESLRQQTCPEFEWLVVDDGSTDNTRQVVEEFSRSAAFPVRYLYQPNRGKASAINAGLALARGEFFLVFDSDDWCAPHAIERFLSCWDELGERSGEYCAISALKAYRSGQIVGEGYGRMTRVGETYVDRFNRRIKGDKWEFIRTSVHRDYQYEIPTGERYQAPEYAWLGMGREFKTLFLDEVLSIVEYQLDGISRNNIHHRVGSPKAAVEYYRRGLSVASNFKQRWRMQINLARFSRHACLPVDARVGRVAGLLGALLSTGDSLRRRLSAKVAARGSI